MLTISLDLFAQDKILGRYRDYFGSRIQLNSDNTFKYTSNFDMSSSWTKGTWTIMNDTVFLHMVPTYDTLRQTNKYGLAIDTLLLSPDELSERLTQTQLPGDLSVSNGQIIYAQLSAGGQNRMDYPDKLVSKKGRLYRIKNGKLIIKKQIGFWTGKKWDPWFFKSDD